MVEGSKILREHRITAGRIEGQGRRGKADIADYVLVFQNTKLAVVEAKAWDEGLTRAKLLQGLADKDFGPDKLAAMQQLIEAEKSDLFDVLAYVAYALPPVTRAERADQARVYINSNFNAKQQAFLDFVLAHYVNEGVKELEPAQLRPLLRLKYNNSIIDAVADLGGRPEEIGRVFSGFQKYLYAETAG
ncbi:MAG: hypothetical protein H2172_15305 [Opitutus sp.]|nr:hypothetical protein [Opitutus sp.]MCS6247674.1 hypothetical protein [Opitutus sp.]MCS6273902.1 hypothetical protein [Opitutus sp.]MCS6276270.1 hypothetical protein [Opitutus sp.]MCS6301364.1 hypothetical protein [Opitutus sp.]